MKQVARIIISLDQNQFCLIKKHDFSPKRNDREDISKWIRMQMKRSDSDRTNIKWRRVS